MNRLSKETSPYLLQHAHNPVNWYPWGEEALLKAVEEDKPILVSIGYAACHWCHVMEKESFENEQTAAFMNEHFVNIKVDREERPDLDHIYMDAVQAINGQGGWPLNVFLTPAKKPFYGGTYFPPTRAFNRASWTEVLSAVKQSFHEKRQEMEAQAENLTAHLEDSNKIFDKSTLQSGFSKEKVEQLYKALMQSADKNQGGFGKAPKFPQTFSISVLLHYYFYTRDTSALEHACLSLDKMIFGGIYDQLAGGFARYSTDAEWLAPHFEKMLYDNALLVTVLSEAFSITRHNRYKHAIVHTLGFIEKEMTSPEAGFYTALDADSEGIEGKYYVWSRKEVEEVLGKHASIFCAYYDITEGGNWEHSNILRVKLPLSEFALSNGRNEEELEKLLEECREKLRVRRNHRIRPLLDDKVLLGWNALMTTAYAKAYASTGVERFKDAAIKNMQFVWSNMRNKEGEFMHAYKDGQAKFNAFLDDHANIIVALISLQEITGEAAYLLKAKEVTEQVLKSFSSENALFYFTRDGQQDVIIRKKEMYDGATPSGNAIMAWNLYYLGIVFNRPEWVNQSVQMCLSLEEVTVRYPTSFGAWATMILSLAYGIPEVALIGENFGNLRKDFLRTFIPFRIFQSATRSDKGFPLLENKPDSIEPKLYLCKNYSCQNAVTEIDTLMRMLENV